ncbi:MAG: nuclear transport factor 2 family protein [Burkholderiales bacterium]
MLAWPLPVWPAADAPRTDAVEEDIWSLEHAYFSRLYRADHDGVLALVHDQFLAWPAGVAQPIGKEESARFMRQLVPAPTSCTVAIGRGGIRVLADVALTEYTLRVDCGSAGGTARSQTSRITHTWVRAGKRWQLLGGMSRDG